LGFGLANIWSCVRYLSTQTWKLILKYGINGFNSLTHVI
jgi:hypothetical protein